MPTKIQICDISGLETAESKFERACKALARKHGVAVYFKHNWGGSVTFTKPAHLFNLLNPETVVLGSHHYSTKDNTIIVYNKKYMQLARDLEPMQSQFTREWFAWGKRKNR